MIQKGVEQRHSRTAVFAALYRAVAHRESSHGGLGADYLAEHFLPAFFKLYLKFKINRLRFIRRSDRLTPGMYEYLLARTMFFDQLFVDALNQGVPQIVLLGAGYDTRAYRFAALNKATNILELDIETTQNRKKECLYRAGIEVPDRVKLVPINFNKESIKDVLERSGYERDKKTVFLWEGVIYYLEPYSVDATLDFVTKHSHHESAITFDYAVTITAQNINDYYGVRRFVRTWREHRSGEPFKFSLAEGELKSFLERRGLTLVNHLNNREIEETFLLHEDGSPPGHIMGLFRFAKASPSGG